MRTNGAGARLAAVNFRTVTVGEVALVLIAIFVVLAYFNGSPARHVGASPPSSMSSRART